MLNKMMVRSLAAIALVSAFSSQAASVDIQASGCVNDPGNGGLFGGLSTGLTGPLELIIPGRVGSTSCATLSCTSDGTLSISPSSDAFSQTCEKAVKVNGSGTGSCTLTITQSTLLGTRTISAKSETFGAGAPTNPFPIEACLARTPKP